MLSFRELSNRGVIGAIMVAFALVAVTFTVGISTDHGAGIANASITAEQYELALNDAAPNQGAEADEPIPVEPIATDFTKVNELLWLATNQTAMAGQLIFANQGRLTKDIREQIGTHLLNAEAYRNAAIMAASLPSGFLQESKAARGKSCNCPDSCICCNCGTNCKCPLNRAPLPPAPALESLDFDVELACNCSACAVADTCGKVVPHNRGSRVRSGIHGPYAACR